MAVTWKKVAFIEDLYGLAALGDPGADKIAFWDDSETALKWLSLADELSITTTTLSVDHDLCTNFEANEHIDYTSAIDNSAYTVKTTAKARAYLGANQPALTDQTYVRIDIDTESYDPGANFDNGNLGTGTADGTTGGHLIDSGYDFAAVDIAVGMRIKNTTDTTYTYITAVAVGDLTLKDDIFVDTDTWEVQAARFVAPVTGPYLVRGSISWGNAVADKSYYTLVYVNGSEATMSIAITAIASSPLIPCTDILYLSAGDKVDVWGWHNAGTGTVYANQYAGRTAFSIHLLSV